MEGIYENFTVVSKRYHDHDLVSQQEPNRCNVVAIKCTSFSYDKVKGLCERKTTIITNLSIREHDEQHQKVNPRESHCGH